MKYKVGDKAKVRNDLMVDEFYDSVPFIKEMLKTRGKEVTIKEINSTNYYIEEDNGCYCYTDEMFENKYSDEEILRALNLIKNICNQSDFCENCKLATRDGFCLINEIPPNDWEINNEKQIKYFK